jgi:hypothetical protein
VNKSRSGSQQVKLAWVSLSSISDEPTPVSYQFSEEPDVLNNLPMLIAATKAIKEETSADEASSALPDFQSMNEDPGTDARLKMLEASGKAMQVQMLEQTKLLTQLAASLQAGHAKAPPPLPFPSKASSSQVPPRVNAQSIQGLNRGLSSGAWNLAPEDGDEGGSSEDSEEEGEEDIHKLLMEQMTQQASQNSQNPDMSTLMNLLLLKEIKKMSNKSSEGEDDIDGPGTKGLAGLQLLRTNVKKNHKKLLKNYTSRVKERLGITDPRQPWMYRDYSMKLVSRFGKLRGLWRCHYMISDILQAAIADDQAQVVGLSVQMLKCLHQVALDRGSWQQGQYLLPQADPLAPEEFGGDPSELRLVHRYTTALKDLKAKKIDGNSDSDDGEDKHPTKSQRKKIAAAKALAAKKGGE